MLYIVGGGMWALVGLASPGNVTSATLLYKSGSEVTLYFRAGNTDITDGTGVINIERRDGGRFDICIKYTNARVAYTCIVIR